MDELVIYEQYSTLAQISDRDQLMEELIVSQSYDMGSQQKSEKNIVVCYEKASGIHGRIPTFSEVFSLVCAHNDDIFYNVAILDLLRDYDYEGMTEVERLREIDRISYNLYEDASFIETLNLDTYVAHVLAVNRMAYTCDSDDIVFDEIDAYSIMECVTEKKGEISLVMNDCQNILLPEFLIGGFGMQQDSVKYFGSTALQQYLALPPGR